MASGPMKQLSGETCKQPEVLISMITQDGQGSVARPSDDDISGVWGWLQTMSGECDQRMSDVTEEDIVNAVVGGGDRVESVGEKPTLSLVDRDIINTLTVSGGNQSTKNDTWSRRRFDEWRLQNGMPTSKAIETMDIETFASQLPTFFLQVMKHNGDHYPLESLLGFYRGFTRIMRKAQEARICETRVIETPFDMRGNPSFQRTGLALLEAMRRSVLAGANKRKKKPAVVSWLNEEALLADKDHQVSHPYGCFRRWTYYCISRFHLRGGKELYSVMDSDFHESRDDDGDYVVFGERLHTMQDTSTLLSSSAVPLKGTARAVVKRVKVDPVRMPVKCYQLDVLQTYRQFMKHQPVKVGEEVGKPRHLFLQPIGNPVTNAWFAKSHVSERVLISLFKSMAAVAGINVKDITTKPGRPILPHPGLADLSPFMRGAVQTSYGTYPRYDVSGAVQDVVAQVDVSFSPDVETPKRKFEEVSGSECGNENSIQQSTEATSARTEVVSTCVPSFGEKIVVEELADSKETNREEQNTGKLEIARKQLKELEMTLSKNIGRSVQEVVQVAMTQLKGLEITLLSLKSVS